MMSPKLIFVILIFHYIRQSEQQVDCQYSGNCNVADNTLEISCPRYPEGGLCSCPVAEDECKTDDYSTLNVDACKTKCQDKPTCKFWKYRITGFGPELAKQCYLMDKDQCRSEDESVVCPDDKDGHPTCRSGYIDRNDADNCDNPVETTAAPPPTTPSPYKGSCPGPIDNSHEDDPLAHYQKWDCWKPGVDGHPEQVDMYTLTAMPTGGYCELIPDNTGSCKNVNYRYDCTAVDLDNSEWTGPDEDNDLKESKLKEIGCKAEPWAPTRSEQPGRRFSCVNGGINAEGKIPAENDCIMLCDNHPVFSFFTDFKAVGNRGWFYELINNPDSKGELVQGMLDCWGKEY